MKRPPENVATPEQRAVLRAELHDRIDQIIDNLPTVERFSREMRGGYSANTLAGGSRTAAELTTVERLADQPANDPAVWALEALAEWAETIGHIRNTARRFRGLMPLSAAELASIQQRAHEADIPTCALCQLPIPDKVKRIDDQAFHASTCYYKVWRSRRASA